jgi:hypothetical protein
MRATNKRNQQAQRGNPMITFQLIGLVFAVMFLGSLVTRNPNAARR